MRRPTKRERDCFDYCQERPELRAPFESGLRYDYVDSLAWAEQRVKDFEHGPHVRSWAHWLGVLCLRLRGRQE